MQSEDDSKRSLLASAAGSGNKDAFDAVLDALDEADLTEDEVRQGILQSAKVPRDRTSFSPPMSRLTIGVTLYVPQGTLYLGLKRIVHEDKKMATCTDRGQETKNDTEVTRSKCWVSPLQESDSNSDPSIEDDFNTLQYLSHAARGEGSDDVGGRSQSFVACSGG